MTLVHTFGGIRQIAMVVRDAESTLRTLTGTLGIGPFYVIRDYVPDDFRYRGNPSPPPRLTLAFAQSGPVQVEVIQQHNDVPSAYAEFLASGREGCQHVAAWFSDRSAYDAARDDLLARGWPLVHENGDRSAGPRFAYFATDLPGALMLEIAEALVPASRPFVEMIAQAGASWDGSDPIRTSS